MENLNSHFPSKDNLLWDNKEFEKDVLEVGKYFEDCKILEEKNSPLKMRYLDPIDTLPSKGLWQQLDQGYKHNYNPFQNPLTPDECFYEPITEADQPMCTYMVLKGQYGNKEDEIKDLQEVFGVTEQKAKDIINYSVAHYKLPIKNGITLKHISDAVAEYMKDRRQETVDRAITLHTDSTGLAMFHEAMKKKASEIFIP